MVRGRVRRRLQREFPPEQWDDAERALSRCPEGYAERLQVAVLNLADGDIEELKRMVRHAEDDFRDVLLWGEKGHERRWIELRRMVTRR